MAPPAGYAFGTRPRARPRNSPATCATRAARSPRLTAACSSARGGGPGGCGWRIRARPGRTGAGGGGVLGSTAPGSAARSGAPRVTQVGELPGYPSRMAPAADGGFWLSCFICRTQLVEFVLREHAYRKRMLREIDPRYWIAPALSSGDSFLEPLQGAGVKQMGRLKPWAPPRSYGLVLRVDRQGQVSSSLHSPAGGKHHGITANADTGDALYAVSKGSGRLLRIPLTGAGAAA